MMRLRRLVCWFVGHTAPNVIGECQRCSTDLLGYSYDEKLHRALIAHKDSVRQMFEWGNRR